MKPFFRAVVILTAVVALSLAATAQDKMSKDEMFSKIAKLTNTKKPEDLDKAYAMSKDFLAKFGKDTDEKVKKIRDFNSKYRMQAFVKAVDELRIADASAFAKEILADEPENSYVTLNLAYGAYDLYNKKKDKSFSGEATANAKQTLKFFEAGNYPKDITPFRNQDEAAALMYYIIGTFSLESNLKEAAKNFSQAVKYESQIKSDPYTYDYIAFFYEKTYETAAKDYQTKHGSKYKEDAEMKADQAQITKIIDRMIDAYARAVKYSETANAQDKERWKTRLTTIYKFRKQSEAGLTEYIANILNTPLPDPSAL